MILHRDATSGVVLVNGQLLKFELEGAFNFPDGDEDNPGEFLGYAKVYAGRVDGSDYKRVATFHGEDWHDCKLQFGEWLLRLQPPRFLTRVQDDYAVPLACVTAIWVEELIAGNWAIFFSDASGKKHQCSEGHFVNREEAEAGLHRMLRILGGVL